jgi:hypothetical protein
MRARRIGLALTRRVAALGMALAALMQLVFLLGGTDRGAAYEALQAVGLAAALAACWGVGALPARAGLGAFAVGMAGGALVRVLGVALSLSRVPLPVNLLLAAGYLVAMAGAILWAREPDRGARHARTVRGGAALVALGYFAATLNSFGGGRLAGIVGLALGAVGFALAAPFVHAPGEDASLSRGDRSG